MIKTTATRLRGRIFPEIQWTTEQKAQQQAEREAFYQRCNPIFDRVKSELIATHYNPHSALQLLRHILVTKTRQFDDTTDRNSLIAVTQN